MNSTTTPPPTLLASEDMEQEITRLRAEVEQLRAQLAAGGSCQCGDDDVCVIVQERDEARARIRELEAVLDEARPYVGPPCSVPECGEHRCDLSRQLRALPPPVPGGKGRHCGETDPDGSGTAIGRSVDTLARRLRALELVVEAAREVRADLEHQFCEQGDDAECVCDPGLDPCPRCRMLSLLARALAALDEKGDA